MTSKYSVRIHNARGEVSNVDLVNGGALGAVHIKGPVRVELVDLATQRGPQIVRTKRVGKDLHLSIEGDTDERADVVLENYYETQGNLLQGLAEDSRYYDYVPTSGDNSAIVAVMADGASSQQALGELIYGVYGNNSVVVAEGAAGAVAGAGAVGAGGLFAGWGIAPYLGLAALGAAGVYAATRNNDNDNNNSSTTNTNNTTNNTNGGGNTGGGKAGPTTDVNDNGSGSDKTPPNAPAVNPTNGKTVSGTSEPGSTVKVYDPAGNLVGTGVTGTDGKYNITLTTPQPHNANIQLTATDPAGNTSGKTPAVVDAQTSAVNLTLTSDTGASSSDKISNIVELTTTGKDSDATVTYSVNGGTYGNYTPPTTDGVYTVTAKTTDTLGNTNTSTPFVFTRDTTTSAPSLALSSDTGLAGDKKSSVVDLLTTGQENGATLSYSLNGSQYNGNYAPPTTDGVYTVVVRSVDNAGNTNSSSPFVFTRDTTTTKPSLVLTSDTGDGSANSANDNISNLTTLTVGNTEAGSNVTYSLNGGQYGAYTPPTTDGVYTVIARSIDNAGNTQDSDKLVFTRDTSNSSPVLALSSDTGTSANDRWSREGLLTTTSDAGSNVTYSVNGSVYGAYTPPTVDGVYTVLAKSVDNAGNTASSTPFVFTRDTTTAAPSLALTSDTGTAGDRKSSIVDLMTSGQDKDANVTYSINGGNYGNYTAPNVDGVYTVVARSVDGAGNTNSSTPFVFTRDTTTTTPVVALRSDTGTANDNKSSIVDLITTGSEANATVSYSLNNSAFGDYNAPTVDGVYTIVAKSVDNAGNSATSTPFVFTRDTTTTKLTLTLANDSNNSAVAGSDSDKRSNDVAINMTGSENGATVTYSINGGAYGAYVTPTTDGVYTVVARTVDTAGNTNDSNTLVFTRDTTTSIPSLQLSTDTGTNTGDRISSISTLTTLNTESDATLSYSVNGGTYGTYTPPTADGVYTVVVRSVDGAGNSASSSPFIFTRDTSTAKPTLALTSDSINPDMMGTASDKVSNNSQITQTGAEAGANVTYSINGGAFGSYLPPTMDGVYTVVARSTDAAGNSADSDALVFTRDASGPTFSSAASVSVAENVSTSTTVYDAQANDNGGLTDANLTYKLAGADAALFNIDQNTGQVTFKNSPNFEAPTDVGKDNSYNIQVQAMDRAGNVSNRDVEIDVTNVAEKGDKVIDLGTLGKLIAPVNVDGKWYYHWDRNGDGIANASDDSKGFVGDEMTHKNYNGSTTPTLDQLFNQKLDTSGNLVNRTDGLDYTTNETRFTTINGVKLALPTAFGTGTGHDNPDTLSNNYLDGTSAHSDNTGTASIDDNNTHGDYAAIWDSFNGNGSFTGGTGNPSGSPTNWINSSTARYWTATQDKQTGDLHDANDSTQGASHYYLQFSDGLVSSWWSDPATQGSRDSYKYFVALEVL